jgi:hypothetical protein
MKQALAEATPATGYPVRWDEAAALLKELKRAAIALVAREGNAGSVHTTRRINSTLKQLAPKAGDWRQVSWKNREAFFQGDKPEPRQP